MSKYLSSRRDLAMRVLLRCGAMCGTADGFGQVPSDFHPQVTVLHSENAVGKLQEERAVLALWYAAGELHVFPANIPRIVVVHGSAESAKVAKLPSLPMPIPPAGAAAVMREGIDGGESVYFLWVFGGDSDPWLAKGMVTILALHGGQNPAEQDGSVLRIARKLAASTSAAGIRLPQRRYGQTRP